MLASLLVSILVGAAYDPAHLLTLGARPGVEYSANAVMETESGRVASRVWFANGKERRELSLATGTTTWITRVDRKVVWTLLPEQRIYQEMPFYENVTRAPLAGEVPPFEIEQSYDGVEVVNGTRCTRNKVKLTDRSNGARLTGFLWITPDDIVVKVDASAKDSPSKFKLELTDVAVATQPSELFEVPSGFQKVVVPPVQGVFRPGPRR